MAGALTVFEGNGYFKRRAALKPTPLFGAWALDGADSAGRHALPASPEGDPWAALYIDDRRQGFYRTTEGGLWRCTFRLDPKNDRRFTVDSVRLHIDFDWTEPDPDHLLLTRKVDNEPVTLRLHRLTAPEHYPLLERKFSWVNEWGYER